MQRGSDWCVGPAMPLRKSRGGCGGWGGKLGGKFGKPNGGGGMAPGGRFAAMYGEGMFSGSAGEKPGGNGGGGGRVKALGGGPGGGGSDAFAKSG